jgi:cyanate lyase
MKQRVGIARALSIEPRILLMDEPFSALDALTRGALQDELMAIRGSMRQTVFMITHDVDEALLLADRILLMTNGPNAWIAEIVENTLPRDRTRAELHRQPNYTPLRNHVIDFLLTRSRVLAETPPSPAARRAPPSVAPRAVMPAAPSKPAPAQSRVCPPVGGSPRVGAEATRAVRCAPAHALAVSVPRPGAPWSGGRAFNTERGEPAMRREQLTEKILDIKRERGLTWKQITDEIGGMSPVLVVGALLGQMKLVKPLARRAATLFGLSQAEERLLNEVPHRGTSMPPTDPLIYRFYELVMVNGPAWKALIEEEFGDGIMSAIDFDMEIERLPNPKGDRVKITMSGKFLPYKYYGSEQGILEYGVKEP